MIKNWRVLKIISLVLFGVAVVAPVTDVYAAKKKVKYHQSRLTRDETEATSDKRYVRLSSGEDRALDLDFKVPGDEKKALEIGNPGILGASIVQYKDESQLILKPLKSGETTILVRDENGNIKVKVFVTIAASNLLRLKAELYELLKGIEGLELKVVGQKVVIDGEVMVINDYERLFSVVSDKNYSDRVLNLVTLSPLALKAMVKRIEDDIKTFAPNVKTRAVNGLVFLEGSVDNADQAKRAVEVARLYLPEVAPGSSLESKDQPLKKINRSMIQNFLVINPPPPKKADKLLRITVHFVELGKDFQRIFGFQWRPGFTADPTINVGTSPTGGVGAGGASFTATLSSLFPKLQSAQNARFARVLRTGTILVRSGQEGRLKFGDQIAFAIPTANGQYTSGSADVGLDVMVTPTVLGQSDDIEMNLNIGQKLVSGRSPSGQPTVANHEVNTKLYVKSTESAAIGGVSTNDVQTSFNLDPPGSKRAENSDPLFDLTRSKNYSKKRGQFVIFVTPQIIENASEGTEDLKKNFRIRAK